MSAESYRKVLFRIGMGQSPGVGEINRENLPLNDLPPGAWKQILAEPGAVCLRAHVMVKPEWETAGWLGWGVCTTLFILRQELCISLST